MKIYEYGQDKKRSLLLIATAALEPYWAFEEQAQALGSDFHVYAVVADGHDGEPGDFISIEKTVAEIAEALQARGVTRLDGAYGLSMGGAIIIRFLATVSLPIAHAIIDGGILPYSYPYLLCRLILLRDFIMAYSITRSRRLLELVAPPERYTADGHDAKQEYDNLMTFYQTYTPQTIANVFWSANNYMLPCKAPALATRIDYWYGEKEKRARKKDIAVMKAYFGHVTFRQFDGMGHGELVMVHPSQFVDEMKKALGL